MGPESSRELRGLAIEGHLPLLAPLARWLSVCLFHTVRYNWRGKSSESQARALGLILAVTQHLDASICNMKRGGGGLW